MVIWTLAKKDMRLLARDPRAMIILLAMPLIFILVLGVSLGDNFGQKAAAGLRVSVLNLDEGLRPVDRPPVIGAGVGFAIAHQPTRSWAKTLLRDINETADIRVEFVQSRAEAESLVHSGKRAAVLIIGKDFSNRVERCSFLADGVNPFYRDGVKIETLDVEILEDPTQPTAVAIIHQVAQGSLLRIVMPWMIGRAFEKIGDPKFLEKLGEDKQLPLVVRGFLTSPFTPQSQKKDLGLGLQSAIQNTFPRYNLTAKTWASLTKEKELVTDKSGQNTQFAEDGAGLLRRGGTRYQLIVPSSLVMFAFFLVLTVGWLFVAERRQGTMKRLVVAPLTKGQILLGKMLPCLFVSLFQGFFLFGAGRLIFDMGWGPAPLWLIPVIAATSFAAIGLAMLVAAVARTETQVAIYGTMLVVVLAFLSGCLTPGLWDDERMQLVSQFTPHAWALDAYKQLLINPTPDLAILAKACGVLTGFGAGFLALAWWCLRLDADS